MSDNWYNIPAEMQARNQWMVCGADKAPISVKLRHKADPTDPAHWCSFADAVLYAMQNGLHIGYCLHHEDPFTIIDLDNKKGLPGDQERCQQLYRQVESYIETSMSGRGLHIVMLGKIGPGRRRDNIEVYSQERFIAMTGDVVKSAPLLRDDEFLQTMVANMSIMADSMQGPVDDGPQLLSDAAVLEKLSQSANADKFKALYYDGDITAHGSDHSRADDALIQFLLFGSNNNAQVIRLFQQSKLYRKGKGGRKEDDYVLRSIRRSRAYWAGEKAATAQMLDNLKPSLEDMKAASEAIKLQATAKPKSGPDLAHPPGLIGAISDHIYASSYISVRESAVAAGIAMFAGIVGRSYQWSTGGLAHYIVLMGESGSGKDGARQGIEKLFMALDDEYAKNPGPGGLNFSVQDKYLGSGRYASAKGLRKELEDKPCMVSVMTEFGDVFQMMSRSKKSETEAQLLSLYMQLFSSSGWNQRVGGSRNASEENSTKSMRGISFSVLGDATPSQIFPYLTRDSVDSGFTGRLLFTEVEGEKPYENENVGKPPPPELIHALMQVIHQVGEIDLAMEGMPVGILPECRAHLKECNRYFTDRYNESKRNGDSSVERVLEVRVHEKATRLAALLAVSKNWMNPVIDMECVNWAYAFAAKSAELIAKRFKDGEMGADEDKAAAIVRRNIIRFLTHPTPAERDKYSKAIDNHIIPRSWLSAACNGSRYAEMVDQNKKSLLNQVVREMQENGELHVLNKVEMNEKIGMGGTGYLVLNGLLKKKG